MRPGYFLLGVFLLGPGCGIAPRPGGLDFEEERNSMVENISRYSPELKVKDPLVLAAMRRVPRHEFVPPELAHRAYSDAPLPIGEGQTISQPFIVGLMTEMLEPASAKKVLEVGTGSGYQAAVLAELGLEVYTIEILESLARRADEVLKRLGYSSRIHVRAGDGYRGWPEAAPFDAVIVTCAPDHVPAPLVEQLREGGRMVIPVGPDSQKSPGEQSLVLVRKKNGKMVQEKGIPVVFVPMTGEALEK